MALTETDGALGPPWARPLAGRFEALVVESELLAHILRGRAVLDRAIELTHSLQLPRLRSGLLMSLEVPLTPPDQASDLVAHLDRVRDLIVELMGRREQQQRTADALVPAALNSVFGSR